MALSALIVVETASQAGFFSAQKASAEALATPTSPAQVTQAVEENYVLYFPIPIPNIGSEEIAPLALKAAPSSTPAPTASSAPSSTPTAQPTATLGPDDWKNLPVIPSVSQRAIQIYQKGQALGNDPKAFSKVGDCNSLSTRFLTYFDGDPGTYYNLESYSALQPVIDQFGGSFKRASQAVGDGYNTSAILSPFRADPHTCNGGESPLACELRLHKPSFLFIAIGTDDYLSPDKFETNLKQVLDTAINLGVVPILATKADNVNQLNYNPIIAKVALEYDIPLWNLWRAMNPLPDGGLYDNEHPSGTFVAFDFTSKNLSTYGWPMRNLTALEALNAVWRGVTGQ